MSEKMLWCAKGKKGKKVLRQCSWTKDGAGVYASRMRESGYKNVRITKAKLGKDKYW